MICILAGELHPGDTVDTVGRIVGPIDRSVPGDVTFQVHFSNVGRPPAVVTLGADMPVWVAALRERA